MTIGVAPDVLPLAPRPVSGELCSAWLQRVAAANVLTFEELLDAFRVRTHGRHVIATLDFALSPAIRADLAAWCRLPAPSLRALDLQHVFPAATVNWFVHDEARHSLTRFMDRSIRAGICPACLIEQRHAGLPAHVPGEWALGCLTHCPRHRALLLHTCAGCFRPDMLDGSLTSLSHRPRCRFCGSELPILVALDSVPWTRVLHLQHAIFACLRGQRPPGHWVGVCTARAFTRLIADLVDVVTRRDRDGGLVLADLLPNVVRWDHRPLRWRVPPGFTTAAPADRLVILGALATILQHRDGKRAEDPFAVLWPALCGKEQQALVKKADRWPAHTRGRLRRLADGRRGTNRSVHEMKAAGSTK